MNQRLACLGHMNGFEHLSLPDGEIEREFDVGYKFEVRESDEYSIDPRTGVKAWAEPFLALYISVAQRGAPNHQSTLSYGLTRSRWQTVQEPSEEDRQELLHLAMARVPDDLMKVRGSRASKTRFRML